MKPGGTPKQATTHPTVLTEFLTHGAPVISANSAHSLSAAFAQIMFEAIAKVSEVIDL